MIHADPSDTRRLDTLPSLLVERDGRRFPQSWDTPRSAPVHQIEPPNDGKHDLLMAVHLRESIWTRLPWNAEPPSAEDREALVKAYNASLQTLETYRQDVDKLVRLACQANLDFRQARGDTNAKARDEALQNKLSEMLSAVSSVWRPPVSVLNAAWVGGPLPELRNVMDESLQGAVTSFCEQFVELMAQLVDREMFGLVEWHPNQCCSYHFFKQVVIQENDGFETRTSEEFGIDPDTEVTDVEDDGWRNEVIGVRRTETVTRGKHHYRHARHQHDVMHAVHTSINNSRVVMPPAVKTLVEAVPDWLYEHVEVIDGDIFRERVIEQNTGCEDWADVQVKDEPIYGCEPGVIIGPFVLTGWGPREVAAETARRQQVSKQRSVTRSRQSADFRTPLMTGIAVTISLLAMVTLVLALRSGLGMAYAVPVTLAALGAIWIAARDVATSRGVAANLRYAHFQTGFWGSLLLLAQWMLAVYFVSVSLLIPLALVLVAGVCYLLARWW